MADQTKHVKPNATAVAYMAKPAQLSNCQTLGSRYITSSSKYKTPKVQVQLGPCRALVQTNLSATLLDMVLMTLAGFLWNQKTRKK